MLAATGAARVIMVGHRMGGLASRADLRRHGSDRVARLIRPGSPHHGSGIAHLGPGRNARLMTLGAPGAEVPGE